MVKNFDYVIGLSVLKYDNTIKAKIAVKTSIPLEIVHMHVNGTITIQLRAGVTKSMNIHFTTTFKDLLV